jgi:CubicO group peptidase (beta-lactamase class C family)
MRRLLVCSIFFLPQVIAGVLLAVPAYAQDRTAQIDRVFSWVKPGMPGCVAAASKDGTLLVNRAYGLADLERNVPLTTESVIDAASIRKQFVAAAILMLVEDKRLALTDDVRKYIPELPDYGRTITLDHMLTHTSGLRDWTGLRNFNSASEPAMPMILRQRALDFPPVRNGPTPTADMCCSPRSCRASAGWRSPSSRGRVCSSQSA